MDKQKEQYSKYFLILLLFTIGLFTTYALFDTWRPFPYVEPVMYRDVKVKIYSEGINESEVINMLDRVDARHYEGLRMIRIYDSLKGCGWRHYGIYYWHLKEIRLCEGFDVLVHELAHHKTLMDKYNIHGTDFEKALTEIYMGVK